MREPPPAQLAALLKQLGLATSRDLESVEATVHRMAGDLPRFESVWIDALRQARFLTHFQAAEIHAGRGHTLEVARYVMCQPVHECGYSAVYRAEDRQTREIVRLAVFSAQTDDRNALQSKLDELIAIGKSLSHQAGMIEAGGLDGSRHWAASPWVGGTSLADFVLHHGRFPPETVLEIARAMLAELAALETAGLVHGDIRLQNILIASDGEVRSPHPGLRGLIRPNEGISNHDLAPDACSTLAPERVTDGTPPTVASDLFACGCVWWHILCGRPPLGGGDTLARLCAAQAAAVDDLHRWAADVPDVLVGAIHDCLQKDPRRRPKSMADLAQRLGPLRRCGRQAIARCLAAAAQPRAPWLRSKRTRGKKPARPHRLTAATIALLAAVAVAWPLWVARNRPQTNASNAKQRDFVSAKPQAGPVAASANKTPREPGPRPMVDSAVTPAVYSDASAHSRSTAKLVNDPRIADNAREELCLPTDRPVRGELLKLKPGQRIRAQGGRARMFVPREGLAVHADRESFENVDFVAEERSDQPAMGNERSPALIRLLAAECEFVGCSFQSANGSPELSAAIVWQHASAERPAAVALPSGRIRLKDCVFRRVGVGIESHVQGAIDLEITNSLHLGPGPMIRLTHAPAADEPVRIILSQVTLREADALVDCRCINLHDPSGEINIEASGCVLAPRVQAALLMLSSSVFPAPLLHEVKWTGQGSVLAGQIVFGRWNGRDGARQTIDDATISIAGLVRGEVGFAGTFDGDPASSQVVNCQAPLQDSESAGATARDLPRELKR
ncbi:MAG: serine/threonine protein kinase [Thermoguttaceae bacterium]